MTKSRHLIRPKWRPDAVAIELVRRNFATSRTADLAEVLGVAYHQVSSLARRLGLHVDELHVMLCVPQDERRAA